MRVLMISADRSKRGILYPGTPAFNRQEAYALHLGNLDIIGFSRKNDGAQSYKDANLSINPTHSSSKFLYGFDAMRVASRLPKPDVITVQDPFEAGLVALWIAWRFHLPLHIQIHTDFLSPAYRQLSFVNRLRVAIAGLVLHRASRIRAVSTRIKDSIQGNYNLKTPISVLPIGVDLERIRVGLVDHALERRFDSFSAKVIIISRLEHEKNVELAIRAYAKSAPPNSCLIIIGEGSQRAVLESLAQGLKAPHVFFVGDHTPTPYYQFADLVLVPSKYEGYGLVIVEALASGKPVLSTDVGVAREAGAIVTTEEEFADSLAEWFKSGPRTGTLKNYPYQNFDDYARAYSEDIKRCKTT